HVMPRELPERLRPAQDRRRVGAPRPRQQRLRVRELAAPALGDPGPHDRHALEPPRNRDPPAVRGGDLREQRVRLGQQRADREHHRREHEQRYHRREQRRGGAGAEAPRHPDRETQVERPARDRDHASGEHRLDEAVHDPQGRREDRRAQDSPRRELEVHGRDARACARRSGQEAVVFGSLSRGLQFRPNGDRSLTTCRVAANNVAAMNKPTRLSRSLDVSTKVSQVLHKRTKHAAEHLGERMKQAGEQLAASMAQPLLPWHAWANAAQYGVDFAQRSVIFWDTLRQRGNNFMEHERQGLPPLLHFDHEMVMDGRWQDRPVNYALLRIVPPAGTQVDARRRPYVIIDPRGGHGPGIGGSKNDSEVGVALRAGHPVYFVVFFRDPEPGQTLLDVCNAEREFLRCVRKLHPDAPKPAIVGNCQGGWSAMMLAATSPDDTGPVVVVGAPMSYWGGAWSDGAGDNPMRYAGGLLGGTWLASLTSDLGAGKFDG